jgi:hypothetical protein
VVEDMPGLAGGLVRANVAGLPTAQLTARQALRGFFARKRPADVGGQLAIMQSSLGI